MSEYKKIVILGNGGSGKSTLGEKLSEKLKSPVYHLDKLAFKERYRLSYVLFISPDAIPF
ncbi:MAG: topology modulation protein [Ignavibacteria bacterium]|nr:topology modulation protein [Ignavibacteria bacterium]